MLQLAVIGWHRPQVQQVNFYTLSLKDGSLSLLTYLLWITKSYVLH